MRKIRTIQLIDIVTELVAGKLSMGWQLIALPSASSSPLKDWNPPLTFTPVHIRQSGNGLARAVPLSDNQLGALVSFTYNLGEGDLKSRIFPKAHRVPARTANRLRLLVRKKWHQLEGIAIRSKAGILIYVDQAPSLGYAFPNSAPTIPAHVAGLFV